MAKVDQQKEMERVARELGDKVSVNGLVANVLL